MKVEEESGKVGLKVNIQKTQIMASGSFTSWQIDGETVETVANFIFGDSKITANGEYSHEIKRCLLLGRKVMSNLNSILKSRDITLPTKVRLVKAMFFPVVMCGCESWSIKTAECRRIDAFELWCWRRLLRVPWTARSSTQSILKDISPEYSLEDWCWSWNSDTLAMWCEDLTHLKRPWCWERLKAGEEGDNRGWDGWMASPTQWTWVWVISRLLMDKESWSAAVHGVAKSRTWLSDWTEMNWFLDGLCSDTTVNKRIIFMAHHGFRFSEVKKIWLAQLITLACLEKLFSTQ